MAYIPPDLPTFISTTVPSWENAGYITSATAAQILNVAKQVQAGTDTNAGDQNWIETLQLLPLGYYDATIPDYNSAKTVLESNLNDNLQGMINVALNQIAGLKYVKPGAASPLPGCLYYGAPGTGKTTSLPYLGQAFQRTPILVSLAGVTQPSDLKGSSRVWVGATPGLIIQGIINAGTMNPIMLLDEIEKTAASGTSGNPQLVLYSACDTAQNNQFMDAFIGFPVDISKTIIYADGNDISGLYPSLIDRFQLAYVRGFSPQEKFKLFDTYIISTYQKKFPGNNVTITDDGRWTLINEYSFEQGSRQLEDRYVDCLIYCFINGLTQITPDVVHNALGAPNNAMVPVMQTGIGVTNSAYLNNNGNQNTGAFLLNLATVYASGNSNLFNSADSSYAGQVDQIRVLAQNIAISKNVDYANASSALSTTANYYEGVTTLYGDNATETQLALILSMLSLLLNKQYNDVYLGELDNQGNLLYSSNLEMLLQTAQQYAPNTMIHVPAANGAELPDYNNINMANVAQHKNVTELV